MADKTITRTNQPTDNQSHDTAKGISHQGLSAALDQAEGPNSQTADTITKRDVVDALQKISLPNRSGEAKGAKGELADNVLQLTSQLAMAYFQNNQVNAEEIGTVIASIHQSLVNVKNTTDGQRKSFVSIDESLTPNYIICLEDGKKLKMLKRHLRTNFNMSPNEYRAKWGLPPDYPMVAPNYANLRSQFAKQGGLGKNRGAKKKAKV